MTTTGRTFQPEIDRQETDAGLIIDIYCLALFAIAMILLHLPFLADYGVHRDELYAYSCSLRLGAGYLDHSLVTPWITAFSHALFGKSVFTFRIFPLLSGAAVILLTGLLTRGFGGRRFAIILAAVCVMFSPYFVRSSHCMSQVSFEALFWTASSLVLLRLLKKGPGPLWLIFGITAGFGLITRPSMLVYGVGVTIALLATPYRIHMKSKWFWLGGMAAFLILLPNLVWQVHNDWATVSFLRKTRDTISVPPVSEFLYGQILYIGPFRSVVCLAGFAYLMSAQKPYFRAFGWLYLATLFLMSLMKSKVYYILPVYPVLIAAGSTVMEKRLISVRHKTLVTGLLLTSGLILLPITLPVLPLEKVDAYARTVSFDLLGDITRYTNFYHDQVGWDQHAETLKTLYYNLPEELRKRCFFLAGSYGAAGALEYFLDFPGRPPVASNNLSWHYWPLPDDQYDVALVLSYSGAWLEEMFDRVILLGFTQPVPLAVDRSFAVWLCLKPKGLYREIWPDKVSYEWL